jgi:hypothetical protein
VIVARSVKEIVFIGTGMDEASMRARLDACLVPGGPAMDIAEWAKLPDPFPMWWRAD